MNNDYPIAGDAEIPALAPYGLARVPGYRVDSLTGEEDYRWRAEWFDWAAAVKRVRLEIQMRCADDLVFRARERELCETDPAYFVAMWLVVEEPRSVGDDDEDDEEDEGRDDPIQPFIPFAYQVKLIYLFRDVVSKRRKQDVYISKARGIGVSYTMLAAAYWAFLFKPWRGRFLSEKLEKADRSHDLDSLFGKVDLFYAYTPSWLRPKGFNANNIKHRQQGMFKNPENKVGQLTAEATTPSAGRGGRDRYTASDESAFQEHFTATHATLGGTTRHRFAWSSESYEKGFQWETAWQTARETMRSYLSLGKEPPAIVVELDWPLNPYHDREWYEQEYASYEASGNLDAFSVEYLRNPDMGYSTYIYPSARNCHDTEKWFDPDRPLYLSIDHAIEDDCASCFWQTHFPDGKKIVRVIDGYARNKMPAEFYAHVFTGIWPEPGDLMWDDEEQFGSKERYFMEWLRTVPPHQLIVYGDPSIAANTGGVIKHKPNSFAMRLYAESLRLRQSRGVESAQPIVVQVKELYRRNRHNERRTAAREALVYTEFSRTDGAQAVKEALMKVRLQEPTEKTTSAPGWIHDRFTHYASAYEFGMVYETMKLTLAELRPPKIAQLGKTGSRSSGFNPAKKSRHNTGYRRPATDQRTSVIGTS